MAFDSTSAEQNASDTNPPDVENGKQSVSTNPHNSLSTTSLARLEHFTWAWYTLPMATGGLALLLSPSSQPHTFTGLATIGKVVYIWDLLLFTLITLAITYRFLHFPGTLTSSLTHPTEYLFFGTSFLSLASIIACIARYGIPSCGPWLITTYLVLFWLYFATTFIVAVGAYILLFTSPHLKIQDMTPAWDLPIFPVMLNGTIASVGASFQPPSQAVPMLVAGLTAQGLGFLISLLMYALYIRRMIQYGLPSPATRPAMFIAVGPPSFTSLALIGFAEAWPVEAYEFFGPADPDVVRSVLKIMSLATAVFIWSLAFWFFCVAVVSNLMVWRELEFKLNWWAYVFPNVGFTIAVIDVGKVLRSEGVKWVGSVMTILMVVLYLFILVSHVRAVVGRKILWDGRDEDVYVMQKKGKRERAGKMGLKESGEEEKEE